MTGASFETVKLVSDMASNIVTITGIAIGGLWTYRTFIRERTRWPKANLELVMSHRELTPDDTLLHVKVKVHNAGRGLMRVIMLRIDVRQVLPLTGEAAEDLRGDALLDADEWKARWPMRKEDGHIRRWGPGQEHKAVPEIEPGEDDEFGSDFVVPSTWETVYIYVYLANAARKRGGDERGWTVTSYYDLTGSEGGSSARSVIAREAA